jgi:hypothetical protein
MRITQNQCALGKAEELLFLNLCFISDGKNSSHFATALLSEFKVPLYKVN